jgi:hypothetical protein
MEVSGQLHAPSVLPPAKIAAGILSMGGWVGSTAGLNAVEKRKISCPAKNRTPIPRSF